MNRDSDLTRIRLVFAMVALSCGQPLFASGQDEANRVADAKAQARGMSLAFQSAAAKMMPCVVTVLAKKGDVDELRDGLDLLDENSKRDYNIGSGVILSSDGLCVTNHHVLQNSKDIHVRMADGSEYAGKDVLSDPSSDIAIFRIAASESLPQASIGNSDELGIGDWVIAIGSPFALDQTVSVGIISSKGRTMRELLEGQLLQTDATINPGNSGGALLDLNGDLIGINTAIATESGHFQGVGFAIPIRRVQWIKKELLEHGKVRRSRVGLRVDRVPQEIAVELNIPMKSGVYVSRIVPGMPADKCGLEIGDIIQEIGGQKVPTPEDFRSVVEQFPADQSYEIKLLRNGETKSLQIQPIVSER